jgi:DNA processing protein
VDDIVEELSFSPAVQPAPEPGRPSRVAVPLSAAEEELFALLDVYPQTIDEITRRCGMAVQKVSELLLMLELKGMIESQPGNQYQKKTG